VNFLSALLRKLPSLMTSKKAWTPLMLTTLWLMSFLLNNLSAFWSPNGSDEYGYIGLANRFVVFENKTFSPLPFLDISGAFSYWIGLLSVLTDMDPTYLFRLGHGLVLAGIVWAAYRFAQTISPSLGLPFAALMAFMFSPVFYPGSAYMLPSLFFGLVVLLAGRHAMEKRYDLLLFDAVLLTGLYWQALPIFITVIGLFLLLRRHPKLRTGLVLFLALLSFISPWSWFEGITVFPFNYLASFQQSYDPLYLSLFWKNYDVFLIPGLLGLYALYDQRKQAVASTLLTWISVTLLLNAFFYASINPLLHIRTLVLFYIGLFLLIAYGLSWLRQRFHTATWAGLSSSYWILSGYGLYVMFIAWQMGTIYHEQIASIPPYHADEVAAFHWIQAQVEDVDQSLLLSDQSTMTVSLNEVNSLTAKYMNATAVDRDSDLYETFNNGSETLHDLYEFLAAPYFNYGDLRLLDNLQTQFETDQILLVISPRTRQELSYYNLKDSIKRSLVLDPNTEPYAFDGESKFQSSPYFELIHSVGEAQVYRYVSF
jgi:uncharacterized membrane protein (DUF485 family)